jgi:hypothetical protein
MFSYKTNREQVYAKGGIAVWLFSGCRGDLLVWWNFLPHVESTLRAGALVKNRLFAPVPKPAPLATETLV